MKVLSSFVKNKTEYEMRNSDMISGVCSSDLPKIKVAPKPVAGATNAFKTMNDTVKKFAEDAKARTEALTADFQERSKEALAKSSTLAEEAVEFTKANVETMVDAGKNPAKNLETLGKEGVDYSGRAWSRERVCRDV